MSCNVLQCPAISFSKSCGHHTRFEKYCDQNRWKVVSDFLEITAILTGFDTKIGMNILMGSRMGFGKVWDYDRCYYFHWMGGKRIINVPMYLIYWIYYFVYSLFYPFVCFFTKICIKIDYFGNIGRKIMPHIIKLTYKLWRKLEKHHCFHTIF